MKLNYWAWFFQGSGGKPGFRRLINQWFLFHACIGAGVAYLTPLSMQECANAVLLPIVGILIGLSFAWVGNAQALLESEEINKLSQHHDGGFEEYVFVYQTAILAIIFTLILWGMAGLAIFDRRWPTQNASILYFCIKSTLFTFSSLTLRECWHVIMGTQWMLLVRKQIKDLHK